MRILKKIKKLVHTYYYNFKVYLKALMDLSICAYIDGRNFYYHSMVFNQGSFKNVESKIIMHYHSLEKGFLNENFKYRYGKDRVIELIKLLKNNQVLLNYQQSQISAAFLIMCKYYEKHQMNGINISDFFSSNDYSYFKKHTILELDVIKNQTKSDYFKNCENNFLLFSKSRSSIRKYSAEKVSLEIIYKVIELAKTAPSVCNRQTIKIYYLENEPKIQRILALQKGLEGYADGISQMFVLVSDRNYFHTIGERNQLFVDGGIFLMNLLYALHYYKIAACPAHWALTYKQDKKIKHEINLSDSEKVICLIPFGFPTEMVRSTLSLRRDNKEILIVRE